MGYSLPPVVSNNPLFPIDPKVFGCICFVRDVRSQVSKLDPKSLKCIFVGYSRVKKGYRCYCPTFPRYFVSSNVALFEIIPISISFTFTSQGEDDDLLVYAISPPTPTLAPAPIFIDSCSYSCTKTLQSQVQHCLLRHQIQSRVMIFRLLSVNVNVSVLT